MFAGAGGLIGRVLPITLGVFLVGTLLLALASGRVSPEVRRDRWLKLATYFVIVHTVVLGAVAGTAYVVGLFVLITLAGALEMHRAISRGGRTAFPVPAALWAAYLVLSAGTVATAATWPASGVVYLYLVVAAADGFAQVVGQLVGRHRLAPRVSPAKTIEGAVGGVLGAVIVSWMLRDLLELSVPAAGGLAAAIAVTGLAGDLSASWVKRRAGLKDFGTVLPGQGGVLDRFDSFLFAAAFVGGVLRIGTAV